MKKKKPESADWIVPGGLDGHAVATAATQPEDVKVDKFEAAKAILITAQELSLRKMNEPFPANQVKWLPKVVRGDSCLAMPYIDARAVMDRLDQTLGVSGWSDEYEELGQGNVKCKLTIFVYDKNAHSTARIAITKEDVGSPSDQPDMGDRMKSAFSDALKRAAVKFGIGRYLYKLPAQWVKFDKTKSRITEQPKLPSWAIPKEAPKDEAAYVGERIDDEDHEKVESPGLELDLIRKERRDYWIKLLNSIEHVTQLNAKLPSLKDERQEIKKELWDLICQSVPNNWKFNQKSKLFEVV